MNALLHFFQWQTEHCFPYDCYTGDSMIFWTAFDTHLLFYTATLAATLATSTSTVLHSKTVTGFHGQDRQPV